MGEEARPGSEVPQDDPRAERFGYICHRCLMCCHHRYVRVNPYEIARLARNRGLTTSEFRAGWTVDGEGSVLTQSGNGACALLGSDGCTVYADRPLACRLYPLGRHVGADGVESFCRVEAHPQSRGAFTGSGTIGEFLATQEVEPFIRAADDYYDWFCAARTYLDDGSLDDGSDGEFLPVSAEDESVARDLLDMDAAIARHCASTGIAAPTDIETRKELHLTILYQQLDRTERGTR
jgi:uncharacterized protein